MLDYENTAAAILPLTAAAYVAHFAGQALWAQYKAFEADRAQGRCDHSAVCFRTLAAALL